MVSDAAAHEGTGWTPRHHRCQQHATDASGPGSHVLHSYASVWSRIAPVLLLQGESTALSVSLSCVEHAVVASIWERVEVILSCDLLTVRAATRYESPLLGLGEGGGGEGGLTQRQLLAAC